MNWNTENITPEEVKKHALNVLKIKMESAKEILIANLDNIVNKAIEERKEN